MFSPSAERNQASIIETMDGLVSPIAVGGHALELASGTGQHAAALARAFPHICWWPSDFDPLSLASISSHRAMVQLSNLEAPLRLDLLNAQWASASGGPFDLIYASNVLHVAPFVVTENLLKGAAQILSPSGVLVIYGPFKRHGDWVSDGNQRFDGTLRETNPEWGIRDATEIKDHAQTHRLELDAVTEMPANNSMLVLRPASHHSASSS